MGKSFRTEIELADSFYELDYHSKILLLGSCFTQNIGQRLSNHKFDCLINPFGISYNPVSISKTLHRIASNRLVDTKYILHREGAYFHYGYHSSISSSEPADLAAQIREIHETTSSTIQAGRLCFISLGTSIVHRLLSDGTVVSNCHKMPQSLFEQVFLTYQETFHSLEMMVSSLMKLNDKIQVVFTVSPIRHTRHGLISNQRSKATLIAAVHAIIENSSNCHYFPSYEIMQDDLRDYRFYTKDLIHPNETAIDYIWDHLINGTCTDETKSIIKKISQINANLRHRPARPDIASRKSFLVKTLSEIEEIKKANPVITFEKETIQINEELRLFPADPK